MAQKQVSTECEMARSENGTRICSIHKKPLVPQDMSGNNPPGLDHLSAWVCPVSTKTLIERSRA